jgi:hypothetical protein
VAQCHRIQLIENIDISGLACSEHLIFPDLNTTRRVFAGVAAIGARVSKTSQSGARLRMGACHRRVKYIYKYIYQR